MQKILYRTNQSNPTISAYKDAVEKGKRNQHILPQGNKWVVKTFTNGSIQIFDTQQEAKLYAESAATPGTAIFTHAPNGLITDRKDY